MVFVSDCFVQTQLYKFQFVTREATSWLAWSEAKARGCQIANTDLQFYFCLSSLQVLADVPCSNDRSWLYNSETDKVRERIARRSDLPALQANLLQ